MYAMFSRILAVPVVFPSLSTVANYAPYIPNVFDDVLTIGSWHIICFNAKFYWELFQFDILVIY